MSGYTFDHLGSVRMGAEGVGSYASAATLTSAHALETTPDSPGIKYVPVREMLKTLTPRRGGQPLYTAGKGFNWGYISRLRAFTVPSSDDASRPSVHHLLRACGFIEVYSNNGGGGPYTLTYTLQDFPEAMDSVTIQDLRGQGTGSNALKKVLEGCRGSLKISSTKGGLIVLEAAGMGRDYTHADNGSGPPADDTPSGQILTLQNVTHTLEVLGGSPSYSGPLEGFDLDTMMNVIAIGDGTSSALVDEVQLQPTDNMPSSVTVAEHLLATWNAQKLLEDESTLHQLISIPSLASANDSVEIEHYSSIESVEKALLAGNTRGHKVSMRSQWPDASAPGITPAATLTITFKTTV